MKTKVFNVIVNLMLFWVVIDLFDGIEINEGVLGYIVCGGIFGIVMLGVIPLIRFFTLPVKFISLLLISIMLSIIVFFFLNFGVPFIDFKDGAMAGFTNRYFDLPKLELSMMGNVFTGGALGGILYTCLKSLQKTES
jgi:uncharacterized membrane protein YvlD (DUF360 family)